MEEDYTRRLQGLLRTLFQFDSTDLDFGIYRIMNQKRGEIEKFINEDLINAVDEELEKYGAPQKTAVPSHPMTKKGLQVPTLDNFGTSFGNKTSEEYERNIETEGKTRNAEFEDNEVSFEQHKAEIYSHIYQFFSRYYDKGDFISLQRYSKQQKYAIPYNGEEVVLYWANKDQYFIKTGKNFQNYTFKDDGKAYTIHFKISNAQVKNNNNKNENRFFILKNEKDIETDEEIEVLEPVSFDPECKELTIFFEYRGLTKEEEQEYGSRNVQDKIIEETEAKIFNCLMDIGLKNVLNKQVDENKNFLRKHLNRYVRVNNTDYFIHKDLNGFLRRELDFYIKNEIFSLDDILESGNEAEIALYMGRTRVFKNICLKIIDFLSQIEEFQKKLFEKKKFVLNTEYCMTMDNVPENLYPEILQNKSQLAEWEKLYGVGTKSQKSLSDFESNVLDLKTIPYLVVDTKFFDQSFKDRLIASFTDLEEVIGGLMIQSENWQALNLLQNKYAEQVKCIYIDPPYNTGFDGFLYKDGFLHSSWLCLMENRLLIAREFLEKGGLFFSSIDDKEKNNLKLLCDAVFGRNNEIATIIWQKVYSPKNQSKYLSIDHEYLLAYSKDITQAKVMLLPRTEEMNDRYQNPDNDPRGVWKPGDLVANEERTNGHYIIIGPHGDEFVSPPGKHWAFAEEKMMELLKDNRLYFGKNGKSIPSLKQFLSEVQQGRKGSTLFFHKEVGHTDEAKKELKRFFPQSDDLFQTVKPTRLISQLTRLVEGKDIIVLDFFAGSGTTAHAVMDFNKEDNGNRKYILVEMGEYFDTVTKPRIQKVMYSNDWKDEKPQSKDGLSHIFKYITLEQYEDTLNNIEFREKGSIQRRLDGFSDYMLHYMLDFETIGSACRLNVAKLKDPFSYTLKISDGTELHEQAVDLVETFNYLLGIHVKRTKTFENKGIYYRVIYGFSAQSKDERKENIIVVWRCTEGLDLNEDKKFIEGTVIPDMGSASKVYINSDFAVEGALPVEPTFSRLMGA